MNDQLPQHILLEIEKRGLSPRPRWNFLLKRGVFWSLAVASGVLGGIAVTIITYIFVDHDPIAYKFLNQSPLENLFIAIPYLWIALLIIFAAVARYGFRHTKTGYKYPTAKIVALILLISLGLGLVLNAFDAGERINDLLTEDIPYYDSLVFTSKDAWTQPGKGLLGGTVILVASPDEFTLRDFKNNAWHIVIDKNDLDDLGQYEQVGSVIKIVGKKLDNQTFQAKQIFPWRN